MTIQTPGVRQFATAKQLFASKNGAWSEVPLSGGGGGGAPLVTLALDTSGTDWKFVATVLDAGGAPVASANVQLEGRSWADGRSPVPAVIGSTKVTNASGQATWTPYDLTSEYRSWGWVNTYPAAVYRALSDLPVATYSNDLIVEGECLFECRDSNEGTYEVVYNPIDTDVSTAVLFQPIGSSIYQVPSFYYYTPGIGQPGQAYLYISRMNLYPTLQPGWSIPALTRVQPKISVIAGNYFAWLEEPAVGQNRYEAELVLQPLERNPADIDPVAWSQGWGISVHKGPYSGDWGTTATEQLELTDLTFFGYPCVADPSVLTP